MQLTSIDVAPRPARALEAGRLGLEVTTDWSNLLVLPGPGNDEVEFDGEILRTAVRCRAGLGANFDLDVELPLLTVGGGVLDGFLEEFHDVLGLGNDKRRSQTSGRLHMEARRRTSATTLTSAFEVEADGWELGDIPVTLSWFPLQVGDFSAGVRAGVEFPSGDASKGYGSGGFDGMGAVVAQWDGPGVSAFGWGGHSWGEDPDRAREAGLDYAGVTSLGLGVEVACLPSLSLLGQVEWETAALRRLDDEHGSSSHLLLWVGSRLRAGEQVDVELALGEDLLRDVSPDITFHVGLRLRL